MIDKEQILEKDSNEYFQLKVMCQILKELTEDMIFEVKDVYFDFGQDWMWTTVVAHNLKKDSSFQVLNPRDWKIIINDAPNSVIRDICLEMIREHPIIWNLKK